MIKIISYPSLEAEQVLKRTQLEYSELNERVRTVIADVKKEGDSALFKYTAMWDKYEIDANTIRVSEEEIDCAYKHVKPETLQSLKRAAANIYTYQRRLYDNIASGGFSGGACGYVVRPVNTAGIYVPGGKAAYPSSVMMGALTAKAANVKKIIMCTPFVQGGNSLTMVAARECGVSEIYKIGGAQAVAAMSAGTESVPKCDVIAGPGNIYVTLAKQQLFGYTGIDMIAGPSEILIIADSTANPEYLAADLLSQAEHDELAGCFLLISDRCLAEKTQKAVERQLNLLKKRGIAEKSIANNSCIILVDNIDTAVVLSDRLAPEHLELCVSEPEKVLKKISNAGAVFLGNFSPEPVGDYYAGPNHVLPTSGAARFSEALSVDKFIKKISVISYTKEMLKSAKDDIIELAIAEGLDAHANSVAVRFKEKSGE